jgi:periplasmic protein TonB
VEGSRKGIAVFTLRKDLLISVIGHCALALLVIIFNPSRGMFRGTPDVMNVDLTQLQRPAGAGQAVKQAVVAKPTEENVPTTQKQQVKKEKTEKVDKTEIKKTKADGKGGLDVSRKVGEGAGEGEGENIGGSDLPYDLGLVLSIIERSWRNPITSSTPITCTIYCQINRDGFVIGEPVVEKSSGIGVFDQAAIFAIKRAGQFPPFPTEFDYDYIGLHLDFQYAP